MKTYKYECGLYHIFICINGAEKVIEIKNNIVYELSINSYIIICIFMTITIAVVRERKTMSTKFSIK